MNECEKYVCDCVQVYAPKHSQGPEEGASVLLCHSLPYSLEEGSLTDPGAWNSLVSASWSAEAADACGHAWLFVFGAEIWTQVLIVEQVLFPTELPLHQ